MSYVDSENRQRLWRLSRGYPSQREALKDAEKTTAKLGVERRRVTKPRHAQDPVTALHFYAIAIPVVPVLIILRILAARSYGVVRCTPIVFDCIFIFQPPSYREGLRHRNGKPAALEVPALKGIFHAATTN
jgi:hypothetical protein